MYRSLKILFTGLLGFTITTPAFAQYGVRPGNVQTRPGGPGGFQARPNPVLPLQGPGNGSNGSNGMNQGKFIIPPAGTSGFTGQANNTSGNGTGSNKGNSSAGMGIKTIGNSGITGGQNGSGAGTTSNKTTNATGKTTTNGVPGSSGQHNTGTATTTGKTGNSATGNSGHHNSGTASNSGKTGNSTINSTGKIVTGSGSQHGTGTTGMSNKSTGQTTTTSNKTTSAGTSNSSKTTTGTTTTTGSGKTTGTGGSTIFNNKTSNGSTIAGKNSVGGHGKQTFQLLPSNDNQNLGKVLNDPKKVTPGGPAAIALQKSLNGQLLTPADRAALATLRDGLTATDPATAGSISSALQADLDEKRKLAAAGVGGGGFPPPGTGFPPVVGGGGTVIVPGGGPVIVPGGGGTVDPGVVGGSAAGTTTAASIGGGTTASNAAVPQVRRYLVIKNDTGEKITVHLQYCALMNNNTWKWFPTEQANSYEAISFEIEAGTQTYLEDEGWRVNGSVVRLWAESASGKEWLDYRDQDLWLVPETDQSGRRVYYAPNVEDFTFTFNP